MSATEKLIELYQKEPLLKGVTLTSKNIKDAVFYVDEVSNCKKCKGLEFCKNKICGIKPVFDGENISYEACQYKVIEDNKLNVDTTFASNYIKNARLSDFATTNVVREKAYDYAIKVLSSKKLGSTGLVVTLNLASALPAMNMSLEAEVTLTAVSPKAKSTVETVTLPLPLIILAVVLTEPT
jgi:hypothetical protein